MSCMLCACCKCLVDTDKDPDSLYTKAHSGECWCQSCRDKFNLELEWDEDIVLPPDRIALSD